MSAHIVYRCDECGTEGTDVDFLVAETDDGMELCADCSGGQSDHEAGGRAASAGEEGP